MTTPTVAAPRARLRRRDAVTWAVIGVGGAAVGVLGIRVLAAGYGADNDTWLMLGTWDGIRRYGHYVPSRFQGAPLAELGIGSASSIGGSVLSGLVSLALAAVGIAMLYGLARRRAARASDAALVTALVCFSPVFVIAATTSHDYIYGFACFFAGVFLVEGAGDLDILGAVVLALAVAARPSYLPLCVAVVLLCRPERTWARRLGLVAVLVAMSVMSYVPAFVASRGSLSFLSASPPAGQGIVGIAGRAVVKGLDFSGIAAALVIATVVVLVARSMRRERVGPPRADLHLVVALGVALVEWLLLPVEASYLLPAAGCLAVLLARQVRADRIRALLVVAVALTAFAGFVDVRLLQIDYLSTYGGRHCSKQEASSARLAPSLETGQLLDYPRYERSVAYCNRLQRRARLATAR